MFEIGVVYIYCKMRNSLDRWNNNKTIADYFQISRYLGGEK
jgi:hypothetical protein